MASRGTRVLRSIAANLRAARRRRGLTQAALAEAANLDVRQVQRAESGKIDVGVVAVAALADALKMPVGRLFRMAVLEPVKAGRPAQRRR